MTKNSSPPTSTAAGPSSPLLLESWPLFLALCVFRILNTFLIQSYFDPDEFWQTMEPAYCQVFVEERPCQGFTWEWTRRPPDDRSLNLIERSMLGPARTYLSVVPVHVLFLLLQRFGLDTYWAVSRAPMILYAVTVAAPVDMAVWYAARWLPQSQQQTVGLSAWCLFCSLSSWFNGYSLVRTFANGQETLSLILAVALVSPELLGNQSNQPKALLRACVAFLFGGMGVAIRFTSVAAFVPMGILLALQQRPSLLGKIGYLFVPCALFGLCGVVLAMVVDYLFFGFWTMPFLGNFHFNVVLDYADLFGSHPPYWYFLAGLPAVSGLLLPFVWRDLYKFIRWRSSATVAQRRLWIITMSYLVIMSFNAHKEFRYIHPVLPLLCLLVAPSVCNFFVGSGESPNRIRVFLIGTVWCTANLFAVLYLGLFHQSGAISVNRAIVAHAKAASTATTTTTERPLLRIHYLTGGCHTTPLHSHLHAPPLRFDTWHLNCSPQCRADPDLVCEAQQFAHDPAVFVGRSYFSCADPGGGSGEECPVEEESSSSSIQRVPPPDYVVTFSEYAPQIRDQLSILGLEETARFPHSINGARIGDKTLGFNVENEEFGHMNLFGAMEVSVDEIILFAKSA